MRRCIPGLIIALIGGCNAAPAPRPDRVPGDSPVEGKEQPSPMRMQPTQPLDMVEGPPIHPSGKLLEWLNGSTRTASGARKLIRLPVVIRFADEYRLALGPAFIGASESQLGPDPVALALDDGGMGRSLLDTMRRRCPDDALGCAVWLEGLWGPLVEAGPEAGQARRAGGWPFAVLRALQLVDGQAAAAADLRVLVQPGP